MAVAIANTDVSPVHTFSQLAAITNREISVPVASPSPPSPSLRVRAQRVPCAPLGGAGAAAAAFTPPFVSSPFSCL